MTTTQSTTTTEDRLQALEFVLGQALLLTEAASVAQAQRIKRLEARFAQLEPLPDDAQNEPPFTLDGLATWLTTCVQRMQEHQSVTPRLQAAISEASARVLSLGESLDPKPAEAGPAHGQVEPQPGEPGRGG